MPLAEVKATGFFPSAGPRVAVANLGFRRSMPCPEALEPAAKLLEPKVCPVAIERSTLATEANVGAWLDRQKKVLVAAIEDGPVLVS